MSSSGGGRNQAAVLTTILNTMASKGGEYKEGVKTNHQLTCAAAERLSVGGPLEEAFRTMNHQGGDSSNDAMIIPEGDVVAFFKAQQQRLKALTEKNAQREARIDSFLHAISTLKQTVGHNSQDDDLGGEEEGKEDYGETIKKIMNEESQHIMAEPATLQAKMQDLRNKLGEKEPRARRGNNNNDDDDDDIEVVRNNAESMAKYKCCITAMWMDDPVTSKTCGHSYSRQGIMSHIKSKGDQQCICPFPGCNKRITQQVLEDDAGMQRKVNRFKRRVEAEEKHKRKAAAALDDDEED